VVKRSAKLADGSPVEMPLLREIVFPVCALSLLGGPLPLRRPDDLVRILLSNARQRRPKIASLHGHMAQQVWVARSALSRQLRFSHFGVALSAAVDGLGVALGRSPMVDAELAAGRLVRPFAKRVVAKASNVFALAWRDTGAVREDQRIAAFRDFALDEACGCELAAGPCGMPASEKDSQTRAVWLLDRARRAWSQTGHDSLCSVGPALAGRRERGAGVLHGQNPLNQRSERPSRYTGHSWSQTKGEGP
jgi:LysR family glycine cleavage system transcriptional activator